MMPGLFCATAAARGATAVVVLLAADILSSATALDLSNELPMPANLDNGTPTNTKLYSLSLGRVLRDHTASAEDASKLARLDWQGRRSLYLSFEDEPLFLGYGTHFAFVYVGTPPQRASVIVNTGSHFTAIPCSECSNCGNHTDPYWDPKKSSTADIVTCDGGHESSQCHGDYRWVFVSLSTVCPEYFFLGLAVSFLPSVLACCVVDASLLKLYATCKYAHSTSLLALVICSREI